MARVNTCPGCSRSLSPGVLAEVELLRGVCPWSQAWGSAERDTRDGGVFLRTQPGGSG